MANIQRFGLFAALLSPGLVLAQTPTAEFALADSTVSYGYHNDSYGFISLGGGSLNSSLASGTGDSVNTWSAQSFAFSGTTSGGINDPTNGQAFLVGDIIQSAAGLTILVQADLSLTGNDATIVFDITTPADAFVAYSITAGSVELTPNDSLTILPDAGSGLTGTLSTGRYSVFLSGTSSFEIFIVPSTPTLALALPLLVLHRRRRS
jgi:hypothetical protein